jgi:hypothetical protein
MHEQHRGRSPALRWLHTAAAPTGPPAEQEREVPTAPGPTPARPGATMSRG